MKIMREHRLFLIPVIFITILLFSIFFLTKIVVGDFLDNYREQEILYEKLIGEQVIINKDTLVVVDYNVLTKELRLSNNTNINVNFLKNQLNKKE